MTDDVRQYVRYVRQHPFQQSADDYYFLFIVSVVCV